MLEPFEERSFSPERRDGALVVDAVGSQNLRHGLGLQDVVPDEKHLVAPTPAEWLDDRAPVGDRGPRFELPARLHPPDSHLRPALAVRVGPGQER